MMAMAQTVEEKSSVKFGEYLLTGKIGKGGVAEIYKGRQESLDRDVAIKILLPKLSCDPDIVRRFERESLVIAKLNHPNIVHVIDRGAVGGRCYFVMEYIDGASMREVINSESIPLKRKLEMIVEVCKALDYAHKNGVIHRDIKPANILIDRQGNARVADFGIAQIVSAPEGEMTALDIVMGTLSYMSPEQKVSATNVDQTTDIYAVGIILYEILVRKKPFGHFKTPSEIDPRINPKFDEIVLKCMAQESKDRYQTAVQLKDAILEAMQGERSDVPGDDFSVSGEDSFLGKCRFLDTIKETRFGSTTLVENRVNKKLYVIKKRNMSEAGRREAKLLSSLKHKNINNIVGAGADRKSTVIISEYAQGGSLADRMARKHEWQKAMEIIVPVASGLDFAHKNNILHGDLRPSNILFDADEVVKICDFGLPPHYNTSPKRNWYSPPEQKKSRQGDIYAIGVILHQMLTGRNPSYDGDDNLLLDDVRMNLPEDVCGMLSKLLAIRAVNRYQTCDEFIHDWDLDTQRPKATAAKKLETPPPEPVGKEK
ncbi:MAG: serine/threonine protein kinase, partial [Candidatus Zixiibacteriota bacterium]